MEPIVAAPWMEPLMAAEALWSNSLQRLRIITPDPGPGASTAGWLWEALRSNTSLTSLHLHRHWPGTVVPGEDVVLSNLDCEGAVVALARALLANKSLLHLDLQNSGIGAEGAAELGKALRSSPSFWMLHRLFDRSIGFRGTVLVGDMLRSRAAVETLKLAENNIHTGVFALAGALRHNTSLRELCLGHCGIGPEGAAALGRALRSNSSLQLLGLCGNDVGVVGGVALAEALRSNTSLRTLNLESSNTGDEGAVALGQALQTNSSLEALDLEDNGVGMGGADALGRALQVNVSLQTLSLGWNNLDSKGAAALAEALRSNASLQALSLTCNRITCEGVVALGETLQVNTSLSVLSLAQNSVEAEGAAALAQALQTNRSLDTLDLSNALDVWSRDRPAGVLESLQADGRVVAFGVLF